MTTSPDSRNEELITLVARCAIRDQAALKLLFERVAPYLNAVVFRILKSDDLAKDVLQEAFLQIWTNAASYRPLDRLELEQRLRERFVSSDHDYRLDEYSS